MSKRRELPIAPFYRIIREEGAQRVSREAAALLRDIVEDIAREIARESWELAQHAKRRTVVTEDISFAAKRILRQVSISLSQE